MRLFLKYIELILTGAGLLVVGFVPALVSSSSETSLTARAVTAILVGVIHGVIFFIIRHRQRQAREETIREIRGMLKDVVNNDLTVISIAASGNLNAMKATERVKSATSRISAALDNISEESLKSWKQRYAAAFSET